MLTTKLKCIIFHYLKICCLLFLNRRLGLPLSIPWENPPANRSFYSELIMLSSHNSSKCQNVFVHAPNVFVQAPNIFVWNSSGSSKKKRHKCCQATITHAIIHAGWSLGYKYRITIQARKHVVLHNNSSPLTVGNEL